MNLDLERCFKHEPYPHVNGAVDMAVHWPVYRAVDRAVQWTVHWTVDNVLNLR